MQLILDWLKKTSPDFVGKGVIIGTTIVAGFIVLRLVMEVVSRTFLKKASEHNRLLGRNIIAYIGTTIIFLAVLRELGVDLTTLLGAAGIVGIALGFASQTSVSNIISGLFLLGEKPFTVGDVIKVGDKTGIILAIDLMSIKIRTFDNLFIRLPNEKVLNTEVVNITRFPIRRLDISISVAYKENIGRVKDILAETALKNPFALSEPEPLVIIQNFGDSGIEFFLGVWFLKTDLIQLKNSLMQGIKERFDAEGIEMPFPHRSLYAGETTKAFPIRIVSGDSPPDFSPVVQK
ncbi:MAG: mechanosensitive ion channel family protein [Treponemataceae bacterium]